MFLPVHRKPWCVLPAGLPFSFICGFPFSPSILIFGSGASDVVTLLPTLFSGVCATSPYLGLVYGAAYLVSPAFEPLSQASFRTPADDIVFAGSCHCQNGLGSYRLSLPWSPLWLGMIAFLTSRSWSPSRSRSPVPSLAPSW